ncbi:Hypp5740 [Branchiostoma lanceolatum]|uniref:Hypp5740 protein n=1 Tax=Branchiostoma lanceolatum TaxID=7740 RepID=A0A8J9WG86_BRALA|nr:Hypp5740 [Branchiostoma lanceolatum]
MEVPNTIGNLEVKTPEAKVEKKPPLRQKEGVERKRASVQSSWAEDELERLYESRKTAVSPAAAVRPKEPPPHPADVSCRPPDPLYVRRVGGSFWSTKRILDWQIQALSAREDPEAGLKPVKEYGEESSPNNAENGEARLRGRYENDGEHGHYENDEEHKYNQYDNHHGHHDNDKEHKYYEYDKNNGHYESDEEHK